MFAKLFSRKAISPSSSTVDASVVSSCKNSNASVAAVYGNLYTNMGASKAKKATASTPKPTRISKTKKPFKASDMAVYGNLYTNMSKK